MFTSHRTLATLAIVFLVATTTVCSKAASQGRSASAKSPEKPKIEANLTDLPAYPHLTSGSMLGHPPTQEAVYNAMTNDSCDKVVAWYRAHAGHDQLESEYPGTSIALGQDVHP